MTTMSLADVESIVGDKPAQVCEFLDEPCDRQATWSIRVHIAVNWFLLQCTVINQAVCDDHLEFIHNEILHDMDKNCAGCGVTTGDRFHAVRL